MSIEQWAREWIREDWIAVPLDDDRWCCVLKKDSATGEASRPHVGVYSDEEEAKHVARCHNRWLHETRNLMAGREPDDDGDTESPVAGSSVV